MAHHTAARAALPELTLRGVLLGIVITAVFTAANVYLGLKVGLTFASSIPAAVISMAVLRLLGGGNILENNIVQTLASAAGTLASVIFVLPGLLMVGYWQGFPFWQSAIVCLAGGVVGVLFTIPLRRAMVTASDLPYPEGVAAAEILRAGSAGADAANSGGANTGGAGAADIAAGGLISAVFSFGAAGLHVLSDGITVWLQAGAAVFRLSTGFSLALLGAGYLIGLWSGLAMLLGAVLSWGLFVPLLTAAGGKAAGLSVAAYATGLWATKVRFIGAGVIGIAAIWSLAGLAKPTIDGVRLALRGASLGGGADETDRDMPPAAILGIFALALGLMAWVFAAFIAGAPALAGLSPTLLVTIGVGFVAIFGFAVAAACGYMAGLVGSSASPISGIAILATIGGSLLVLALTGGDPALRPAGIALVLFIVSAVLACATISNDNLQDLKTGALVGATPWRQQVALLIGCAAGALAIPPVLNLLYQAYGFAGAMPRAGMDPNQVLAAPQATLMAKIATGILGGTLEWRFIGLGAVVSLVLISIDLVLERRGGAARLPVLAVGIGLYLPPTVGVTLGLGAVLGHVVNRRLAGRPDAAAAERRGVLLASGFIVGESLIGVAMAAVIGATGSQAPLAIAGEAFEPIAQWLSLAAFAGVGWWMARRVLSPAR